MPDRAFRDPAVAACFAAFPEPARAGLMRLRCLIFDVAEATPEVQGLSETLKWGQPAYLTVGPKCGSALRLGLPKSGGIGLFAHCQTTIIADFRSLFPDDFAYDGNRGVVFTDPTSIATEKLRLLISAALTYHRR